MSASALRRLMLGVVDRLQLRPGGKRWLRLLLAPLFVMIVPLIPAGAVAAPACPNAPYRTGLSAALPDCRAYEQVSPTEKEGVAAVSLDRAVEAMPDGEGLAYLSFFGAFSDPQSASLPDAYVARRGAQGWATANVSPPAPGPTPPGGDEVTYVFTEDLSQWQVNLPLEPLVAGATQGVYNLFLDNGSGKYTWINDATPAHAPPEGCPAFILVLCYQLVDRIAPAGASADLRHILFESTASLVASAPEGSQSLYESFEEAGERHVRLAGILPDGTIPSGGSTAGSGSSVLYGSFAETFDQHVANAISQDGSRVVFQAESDEGTLPAEAGQAGKTEVYDRVNAHETVELSAPAAGATPHFATAAPATFWAASADGSRVFFTSSAELTTSSYTGATEPKGQDLYEYDLETKALKDLTVDSNLPADAEEGAAVQGVVGASSDGSYVYFVAKGQLVPGKGVDHADNLYMVHDGGTPVFIATLSASDEADWAEKAVLQESYVTPDGKHMAFTSVESLPTLNFPSGYDNVNESTATAEREVYEYSAPSEESGPNGSTVCASCDPSGAPPLGAGLLGGISRGETQSASSTDSSPFHQVRVVSDNGGRVFFSSKDPLTVAAKGNTHGKVYEFERDGEGSCETAAGCVYLISSPSSTEEAVFLDADAEGNNVFFATTSQLTPSDQDSLMDVYDARIGGGFATSPTEVPCRGSCRAAGSEGALAVAPLSGSTGASGNLPAAKKLTETRADKLAKALKACHKKKGKRRRRSCETRARKRDGAAAKAHRSIRGGQRRGR